MIYAYIHYFSINSSKIWKKKQFFSSSIFFCSCYICTWFAIYTKTPSICNLNNNFLVCIIQCGDDFYATYDFWEMLVVKAFSSLSTSCSLGSITNLGNHLSNIRQNGIGKSNAEMNIFIVIENVVLSYNLIFIYLKRCF